MPQIRVISPGFQTTVQDLGRRGYAHLGVSASGAADQLSLRIANLLVGNPDGAACLEMTLVGGTFEFESGCFIALTGSDFGAKLDGHTFPLWASVFVQSGQVLRCGPTSSGARCYLSVQGGLNIPLLLGSASTHVATAVGGFDGRPLKGSDCISYHTAPKRDSFRPCRVKGSVVQQCARGETIRVTSGLQAELFPDETRRLFAESTYYVTEEANRMGLRLSGPPLKRQDIDDLVTEGVPLGAVQVPPDGEPIILFVEHQTTGGYPKIANVIAADFHVVGQLRPRESVHFEFISIESAVRLLIQQEALISPDSLEPL